MGFLGNLLGLGGISAGLGGLSALTARQGQMKQANRFTPQQQSALNNSLAQGQANSDFGPIEDRARQQFQTQTVPSLAERFTSMGGGQRSSAFQGALGNAATGLESNLAALRSQHGMQQLQTGLTPQFENYYEQGGPGIFGGLSSGFNQSLGPLINASSQQYLLGGKGNQQGQQSGGDLAQRFQSLSPVQKQQIMSILQGA